MFLKFELCLHLGLDLDLDSSILDLDLDLDLDRRRRSGAPKFQFQGQSCPYLHIMFHAWHCVDPKVVLSPAVSDVDVSVIGDVVAATVFLETRKAPRATVAEMKPAPPLVPHLHLAREIQSLYKRPNCGRFVNSVVYI